MSVFTTVTQEQLSAWLESHAVGTLAGMQGIAEGVENTNYFVATDRGRFVLTLFEKLGPEELPFYVELMAHLARQGIPCPAPIADRDGECLGVLNGKPAVLATFLPGASVIAVGAAHCAAAGEMLARMHLAGQDYGRHLENPRGPRWWQETSPKVMPFLDAGDRALLTEELRFQTVAEPGQLPRGIIHADLFRDNVLFDKERIGGVVDFYFACEDALLFDLAVTVNDWCAAPDGSLREPLALALLSAYHRVRPLTREEEEAWPRMLRGAALRFWLSRLHDLHLPRAGELVRVRDPSQYRAILAERAAAARLPWI